ncbi:MAG TPA: helix-turn-helix transcriptional regulator [Terriglobia bacterium]|nr:helix-turn-helix transcriptional regulator [Terriglobia bacterium]
MGAARTVSRRPGITGLADGATNTHVRQQIRRLRLARGWTQRELALAAGISPSSLGCLETGFYRLNLDTLHRLVLALDATIADVWPPVKLKNSAEGEHPMLPGIDQVSFFRLREVHLLSSAEASCLFGGICCCDSAPEPDQAVEASALQALYTINVEDDERAAVARHLASGTLTLPWVRYSYHQPPRCLFLALKNPATKPWLEQLIERYLPAWLAAFQV